jgi:hypothetical protein
MSRYGIVYGLYDPREDLDALEVHLIIEARQRGEHLTNHADGGGGRILQRLQEGASRKQGKDFSRQKPKSRRFE